MTIYLILALLIAIIAVIFALQNTALVAVQFLFWQTPEISLALLLLITFVVGVVAALLVTLPGRLSRSRELSAYRKKVGELKQIADKTEEEQAKKVPVEDA